jgi:hypothetical protein
LTAKLSWLSLDPTVRDPYESKMVELSTSEISGADEGLFAKVPIEVNTTIAFYNGASVRVQDFNPDSWESNKYKIFDPLNVPCGTIDIPAWAQVNTKGNYFYVVYKYFLPVLNCLLCHLSAQDQPQLPAKCPVYCV